MESDSDEHEFDGRLDRPNHVVGGVQEERDWEIAADDPEIQFRRRHSDRDTVDEASASALPQDVSVVEDDREMNFSEESAKNGILPSEVEHFTELPTKLSKNVDRTDRSNAWYSASASAPSRRLSAPAEGWSATRMETSALDGRSCNSKKDLSAPFVGTSQAHDEYRWSVADCRQGVSLSNPVSRRQLMLADQLGECSLSPTVARRPAAARSLPTEDFYTCESDSLETSVRQKQVCFKSQCSEDKSSDVRLSHKERFTGFQNEGREEVCALSQAVNGIDNKETSDSRRRLRASFNERRIQSKPSAREIQDSLGSDRGHKSDVKQHSCETLGRRRRSSGHDCNTLRYRNSHHGWGMPSSDESSSEEEIRFPNNRRFMPSVKLESYTGESCLETFLAKFENISTYLHWKKSDRLFHLRASLEGAAGQILWDAGPQTSADEIIRLLRARFGNSNQAERFRAELRARRRKKNESLQSLYNDVCKLLALAFPGPSNPTTALVGRDAFLDALDDKHLRIRVLEREPKTLEEALNIASRLEAYDKTSPLTNEEIEEERYRNGKARHVRTVTKVESVPGADGAMNQLTKQLSDLCQALNRNMQQMTTVSGAKTEAPQASAPWSNVMAEFHPSAPWQNATVAEPQASAPWSNVMAAGFHPSAPWQNATVAEPQASAPWSNASAAALPFGTVPQWSNTKTGWTRSSAPHQDGAALQDQIRNTARRSKPARNTDDCCHLCGERGHWRRNCPRRSTENLQPSATEARFAIISTDIRPAEIYVSVRIAGTQAVCLLDTGCERSIIGRKLIPHHPLTETNLNLYAANGTSIPLLGAIQLQFTIDGYPTSANLVVSDAIEELILGIDWLANNNCQWDFGAAKLRINKNEIQLYRRPRLPDSNSILSNAVISVRFLAAEERGTTPDSIPFSESNVLPEDFSESSGIGRFPRLQHPDYLVGVVRAENVKGADSIEVNQNTFPVSMNASTPVKMLPEPDSVMSAPLLQGSALREIFSHQ
jgi:hypothetical protein